jgi:hypothetical protein
MYSDGVVQWQPLVKAVKPMGWWQSRRNKRCGHCHAFAVIGFACAHVRDK